jgi:type II secretory ATPase GspE/PulE/Tfp pilus assembly ATPase PilB-like protein
MLSALVPLDSMLLAAGQVEVGGYINPWKILPPLVLLFVWGRLLTWIDKDTDAAHLPREGLNLGMIIGLIVGFALFFFLPTYALALPALIVVMLIEIGVYLALRNAKVGLKDLKQELRSAFAGKGKKVKVIEGAVTFFDKRSNSALPVPDSESPDRPAYDALQNLFTDPLRKNAERIDITPGEGASQVRFMVDGVPYSAVSMDRATASAAINFLKPLAGLNEEEKRKPQTGGMKIQLDGKKRELEISTAGSSAGEFLKVMVDPKKRHSLRIEQLGFSPEQLETVKNSVQENTGIVLVAAPKAQGLTSMLYALLRAHDAFLQHIQTVERVAEQDLEGITQNKLAANAPAAEEAKQVAWISSQEPDVFMINQMEDANTPRQLIDFVQNGIAEGKNRRVYVGMRAANAFDALAIWRKMVGDDQAAMSQLNMVVAGRVMRKLCMACKLPYSPDPEQLRKLNINPANASKLFQARKEPMRDQKGNPVLCTFCQELRYNGRFGVYEVLVVDEDIRNVVNSGGSINQLKAAFRKQKGKLLQEMALAAVEAGDTSLAEVKRVMEATAPPPAAGGAGAGGGGGRTAPPRTPVRPATG